MNPSLEEDARILIVDDDGTMRLMLRRVLERDGYAVEEADNNGPDEDDGVRVEL